MHKDLLFLFILEIALRRHNYLLVENYEGMNIYRYNYFVYLVSGESVFCYCRSDDTDGVWRRRHLAYQLLRDQSSTHNIPTPCNGLVPWSEIPS